MPTKSSASAAADDDDVDDDDDDENDVDGDRRKQCHGEAVFSARWFAREARRAVQSSPLRVARPVYLR